MAKLKSSIGSEGRICVDCGGFKPWQEFAKCQSGTSGHMSACKNCCKIRWENYRTNPVTRSKYLKHLEEKRLEKHGLAPGDYARIFEAQGGLCALCGNPPIDGKRLVIEHDHFKNKFRSLTHQECNTIIGIVETKNDLVKKVERYLRLHSL